MGGISNFLAQLVTDYVKDAEDDEDEDENDEDDNDDVNEKRRRPHRKTTSSKTKKRTRRSIINSITNSKSSDDPKSTTRQRNYSRILTYSNCRANCSMEEGAGIRREGYVERDKDVADDEEDDEDTWWPPPLLQYYSSGISTIPSIIDDYDDGSTINALQWPNDVVVWDSDLRAQDTRKPTLISLNGGHLKSKDHQISEIVWQKRRIESDDNRRIVFPKDI